MVLDNIILLCYHLTIVKQTIIYLTEEQHEALRTRAFKERTSITAIVREAIEKLLKKDEFKNKL